MGKVRLSLARMFSVLRTGWSILGITLLLIIFLEAGLRTTFLIRDRLTAQPVPDRRVLTEGYGGETWPIQHYRELEQIEERWQPYVFFRPKPMQGQTIKINSDGLRATWQSPAPAGNQPTHPPLKLLMLGGSSLWGFGARDDQTIPSLVARMIHERGRPVEVRNLSEIGYVNTQELIALTQELQAGYRPDIVVFYDGVNDTTSALLAQTAGVTTNEINRRQEFNLLQSASRLAGALGVKLLKDSASIRLVQALRLRLTGTATASNDVPPDEATRALAADAATRYAANVKIVQALAQGYGFRPLFFWQPVVFTKPKLTPFEREELAKYVWAESTFRHVYGQIRDTAALRADPAFHDISEIFAEQENLVFIDYCHTTEDANATIAKLMADRVLGVLKTPP
jgi:lysophospholipase L1-like esterase